MQNNCGVIFVADNGAHKDYYEYADGNTFKQNSEKEKHGHKSSIWIYKLKKFYELVNSDEEKCVATDSQISLFRASKELLSINADGEVHKSLDENIGLAEKIKMEEEGESKKDFARVILLSSMENKCTKIFPILKKKEKVEGSNERKLVI